MGHRGRVRARVGDSVGITMVPLGRDIVGCHARLPVQRLGRRDGLHPARLVRVRAGFGFGFGFGFGRVGVGVGVGDRVRVLGFRVR